MKTKNLLAIIILLSCSLHICTSLQAAGAIKPLIKPVVKASLKIWDAFLDDVLKLTSKLAIDAGDELTKKAIRRKFFKFSKKGVNSDNITAYQTRQFFNAAKKLEFSEKANKVDLSDYAALLENPKNLAQFSLMTGKSESEIVKLFLAEVRHRERLLSSSFVMACRDCLNFSSTIRHPDIWDKIKIHGMHPRDQLSLLSSELLYGKKDKFSNSIEYKTPIKKYDKSFLKEQAEKIGDHIDIHNQTKNETADTPITGVEILGIIPDDFYHRMGELQHIQDTKVHLIENDSIEMADNKYIVVEMADKKRIAVEMADKRRIAVEKFATKLSNLPISSKLLIIVAHSIRGKKKNSRLIALPGGYYIESSHLKNVIEKRFSRKSLIITCFSNDLRLHSPISSNDAEYLCRAAKSLINQNPNIKYNDLILHLRKERVRQKITDVAITASVPVSGGAIYATWLYNND